MAAILFFTPSQECPGTREGEYRIAIDGAVLNNDGVYSVSPYTFRKMRKAVSGEGSIKYCPRFRFRRKLRRMSVSLHRDIFCTPLDLEDWA